MRLAIVSPYPDKERTQLTSMSTVAQYTDDLLRHTLRAQGEHLDVTAITEILDTPEQYSETIDSHTVAVNRCYHKGTKSFLAIARNTWRGRFDIVHIQHEIFQFGGIISFFAFPLFLLAVRLKSKAVATLHHVIPQDQVNASFREIHQTHIPLPLVRLGFRVAYKAIGMAASKLIVHEEFFKRTLVNEYGIRPEKISVIFHGIRPHDALDKSNQTELRKEFHVPEDTQAIFGFFGYISKYKGIDVLIREFQEHLKTHPQSTLVIAGAPHPRIEHDPVYQAYVDSLLASVGTSKGRIVWMGRISDEQIRRFYTLIDCLVLPYRLTSAASSVLSDAIGYGVPMLVSGGLSPTITNPVLLFTLEEGKLSTQMDTFIDRSDMEKEAVRTYINTLRDERLLPAIGTMTHAFYEQAFTEKQKRDTLVLGAYGQTNLGDEYLLDVTLDLLGRNRCIVLSSNPQRTSGEHGVASVSFRSCMSSFLQSRFLIVGGGDQFKLLKKSTGHAAYELLWKMVLMTVAARIWRKKMFLMGIGIGSIPTAFARALTAFCLKHADAVTTRDEESAVTARTMTGRQDISCGGDLSFLKPLQQANATTNVLGIAPAFELEHAEVYEAALNHLAHAADSYLNSAPHNRVSLLPFQPAFHAHTDMMVCTDLQERMTQKDRCTLETSLSKDTVSDLYGRINTLWGVRLHSLLFALARGIPFIALVYDEKVRRFLKDTGCEQWGIELDTSFTMEKLMRLQAQLEHDRTSVIAHLTEQRQKLMEKANIHRDALSAFLSPDV